MRKAVKIKVGSLLWLVLGLHGAAMATYPEKPITLVVPFSPGGNLDMTARIIGKEMADILKQPIVVENKPGAGGAIGGAYVAKSRPDGYTLLLGSPSTMFGNPTMFPEKTPYRVKDLQPVGPVTRTPLLLLASAESRYRTFNDLLDAARTPRSGLSFAHPGIGTINQVAIVRLEQELGSEFISVPFKGSLEGIQEVLGGRVDFSIAEITVSRQLIDGEKLRPLALIGDQRAKALPNVPTIRELGVRHVDSNIYTGILAPANTSDAVIRKLSDAMMTALDSREVQENFAKLGVETFKMRPGDFQAMINEDARKLQELLDSGHLSLQ